MIPQLAAAQPEVFRESEVDEVVEAYLAAGERDPALIASNTASRLFSNRRCRVFPPPPGAPLPMRAAWDRLLAHVDDAFARHGFVAGDERAHGGSVPWRVISTAATSPDLECYPWNEAALHEGGRATPGTFWMAGPHDTDASLVRDYLFACLAMAGVETTPAMDDSKLGRRLRRDARELIVTTEFNDARVTSRSATLAGGRDPGTHGAGDVGVTYVLGSHGRGLVWAPRHYDDLARLAAGLTPKRGVDLAGEPLGSGRSRMLLYLVAINLQALRGGDPVLTTEGLAWRGGGVTSRPPPAVDCLGIDTSGVEPG